MVSYKLDKYDKYFVAFILVILVIFNIGSCFASEQEGVDITTVSNIGINDNSNYFVYTSGTSVGYVELQKGYIYHITIPSNFSNGRKIAICDEVPALNVTFDYLGFVEPGDTYSYLANSDSVLFLSVYSMYEGITVTREKVANMDGAVGDLVSNVGVNQLWSVFEGGIDFIGVVVLVAFGLFLIVLLIKKLSKGKSDF